MINRRIRTRLKQLGYTQRQLANKTGITPAGISQIISGTRTPASKSLHKIAKGLNVSTDFLLGETKESEIKDLLNDEGAVEIFINFQRLSQMHRNIIKNYIKFLELKEVKQEK